MPDEKRSPPSFPVVAVGASAGGLQAFRTLLDRLPADAGMAYVLIPHLDPTHASILSELLSRTAKIPVREVTAGMRVEPGHAYVIRPNTVMTIAGERLDLVSRDAVRGPVHGSIDHFMLSLAREYRERAIGVVLSGTASDGSAGIEAIKAGGGVTFAQDDSAEFKDMPRNAVATGAVDFVLPPEGIARELVRISRHPYLAHPPHGLVGESGGTAAPGDLEKILFLLRRATGVDFVQYKRNTVERRIARRMAVLKLEKLPDYGRHLEEKPEELRLLYDDLLITVTSFFRDPETFEVLRREIPGLLKNRAAHAPVRVWVPGCSSGEELYSLAILLTEVLEEKGSPVDLQLFGTDISERALERARAGVYESGIRSELSADRLRRFFAQIEGGRYRISKTLRDVCVFARHDVTRDPPFSRLDLLSCRNVLIYLGASAQKRVTAFFHYALKPNGFLLMGSAESMEQYAALFAPVDKKCRIYSKLPGSPTVHVPYAYERAHHVVDDRGPALREGSEAGADHDAGKAADRLLLARYVPAGIVVNDRGQVVEVRGETGPYLRPAPGKPSPSILKMVREDLVADLDAAVREARRTGAGVRRQEVRFKFEDRVREVDIEVAPLATPAGGGRHVLVLFREAVPRTPSPEEKPPKRKRGNSTAGGDERDREIARLKEQLAAAREYQQSAVEKLEATNEELRSSSEETLSANEELQSTNEELETSKEELQSANEELTTLNDELQHKNLDLGQLNSDLTNVIAGVNIPLAIVDAGLRLRRFTPQAEKLLNVAAGDVGRRITEFRPTVEVPDLERLLLAVLETLTPMDQEVRAVDGRWYSMRVRPYRTPENRIDGAVIVFVDIDALKHGMAEIEEGRSFLEAVLESGRDPVLVLDEGLRVKMANAAFYETFRVGKEETDGVYVCDLGNRQWNIPRLRELLEEIVARDTRFKNVEIEHDFPNIGRRSMLLHARRVAARPGRPLRILLTIEDVTDLRHALHARLMLASVVESSQDAIITTSLDHVITSWNDAAGKIFGYEAGEVLGKPLSILLPPGQRDHPGKIDERLLRGERIPPYDATRLRKDGSLVEVSITTSPLVEPGGRIAGISKIARDIRERKRRETEIRAAKDSLERRVRARTAELEAAFNHLDAFTYTVSHDLRAPLRAMSAYSQMLLEEYAGKVLDETAQDYARRVAEASHRMDNLVQGLLEYSRLARTELPLERVDLGSLLSDVLKALDRELRERKAEVTAEEPLPAVLGHRLTLEQVLTNLISNAAKFVAPGVQPRIGVRKELRDELVRLWIEDNGIGIAPEYQSRIFGVFERLHKHEDYPGTGIGLAIAKKAMERMGGRIGLESQEGRGSRFWIELPKG